MENFECDFTVFKPALIRQIQSWFWLNAKMRKHITGLDKLVDVDGLDILIDLHAFNQFYVEKFIKPDFEAYCLGILNLLTPYFNYFTEQIGYGGFCYGLKFRLGAQTFEKGVVVVLKS